MFGRAAGNSNCAINVAAEQSEQFYCFIMGQFRPNLLEKRKRVYKSFRWHLLMSQDTTCLSFINLRDDHRVFIPRWSDVFMPLTCSDTKAMYVEPDKSPTGLLSPSASCLLQMDFWSFHRLALDLLVPRIYSYLSFCSCSLTLNKAFEFNPNTLLI